MCSTTSRCSITQSVATATTSGYRRSSSSGDTSTRSQVSREVGSIHSPAGAVAPSGGRRVCDPHLGRLVQHTAVARTLGVPATGGVRSELLCAGHRGLSHTPSPRRFPGRFILGIRDSRPSEVDRGQDADWHTMVTLEIGPHPGLSEAQKKVVALDYGMRDGKASVTVRKALLYYTLKRLGLDTDPSTRSPADQQIVLLNREVLDGVA